MQPSDAGVQAVQTANRFEEAFVDDVSAATVPIEFVPVADYQHWLAKQPLPVKNWLKSAPKAGTRASRVLAIPSFDADTLGTVCKIVAPFAPDAHPVWTVSAVAAAVPPAAVYTVKKQGWLSAPDIDMGWALADYSYDRYKSAKRRKTAHCAANGVHASSPRARLVHATHGRERDAVLNACEATYLVRDIITTPAEDFGPQQLESACATLADALGAHLSVVRGDDLLTKGYPQVHTVGRAADVGREPRVLELVWNEHAERTVALVGKGVCFDTGGLSIKSSSGMVTMKKDLGGAAQVLGLASMLMRARVNARVRVLIAAVENSVSASAYRPGDILTARNGVTTLNINSDAEGRLIVADCLAAAAEENPALIIDCATLTGAQRVALGPDIPAIFCNDDVVSGAVWAASKTVHDLVWPLPLHAPYRCGMMSNIADIKSCAPGSYGGAIHAALYLQEFVGRTPWVHMDFMGYNLSSTPGRPEGGEAMGMRALFHYLHERFGASDK